MFVAIYWKVNYYIVGEMWWSMTQGKPVVPRSKSTLLQLKVFKIVY